LGPADLVGKSIQVEKLAANTGAAETVIAINNWDFDYQGLYTLKNKLPLEAGSGLRLTCTYDNSVDNPRNPNSPPVKVVHGEASTDEMCLAFVGIVLPEGLHVGTNQRQISQWLMRKTGSSRAFASKPCNALCSYSSWPLGAPLSCAKSFLGGFRRAGCFP
jgi:hypothetical protein